MKILYITSLGFKKASSASIRNIGLINGIVNNGNEVDLLTIKYPEDYEDDYLKNNISKKVKIFNSEIPIINKYLSSKKAPEKIEIEKKFIYYLKLRLKNLIKAVYFFPDVDKYWINNYNKEIMDTKYDLIISSSDTKTSHFVAQNIIKRTKCTTWYQIWGDPWSSDIGLNGYQKIRARLNEKKIINKATKIFYVSLPTTNEMKNKYPRLSNKITYLGRSYFKKCYGKDINNNGKIVFTYTGEITRNRNIIELTKKIQEYNKNNKNNQEIVLEIYGKCEEEIAEKLSEYEFIKINGVVSFENILEIYNNTDVLIFIDNGNSTTQIPGKLYDYFGTDRIILALLQDDENDVAKFIKSTNRCNVYRNSYYDINFDFLDNIERQRHLLEYSGERLAEKLLNEI